jgi:hypothetical protein
VEIRYLSVSLPYPQTQQVKEMEGWLLEQLRETPTVDIRNQNTSVGAAPR